MPGGRGAEATAVKRVEGLDKLTGAERYVDDLTIPGCLWGMTVRSPAPRGRVREVRFGTAVDWSEFTIVDQTDIPGENAIKLLETDQPVLAGSAVRHVHEPVLLLAHESREMCRRGVAAVEIVVESEDPIFDFRLSPTPDQIQHGSDNVLKRLSIVKGDVEAALAAATYVVEGAYETGAQEHVYLETQGMVAWVEDDGAVVVKGSMQCPYYIHAALTHALGRDDDGVRVIHAPTGGGFGGKEEYPSTIAAHAALLALKAGRPVKIIYDRGEDMAATTKRHPAQVRHRTGLDAEGRLLAQDIEVDLDGGAYVTLSPVVLSRAIIHAAGPYSCDNVRIVGRAMLTNSVPYGAFRGFGAPQSQFANERHMDIVASRIGMDPAELRRINLLREGETTSTGQVISDGADRIEVLDAALRHAEYAKRQERHVAFNAEHPYLRRGIGLASFYHGAGFTGAGEVYLKSRVGLAARPDGSVAVLAASTEMGQGTTTVFTQIAAERLGYADGDVSIVEPDTAVVPDSGPTVASRTVMVVGHLVERACDNLRARLEVAADGTGDELKTAIRQWYADHPGGSLQVEAEYHKPEWVEWDDEAYCGDAYAAFSWATYIAEVEVDLRTCNTRVTDFVAVQEVGRVMNETLARGQVQGGVVQGIGWALMEECKLEAGAMRNNQLTNYIIPTSVDVPPVRVFFLQKAGAPGPGGAKGIGEMPIDGPAPAVINAVAAALGRQPTSIPLTPERLFDMLEDAS